MRETFNLAAPGGKVQTPPCTGDETYKVSEMIEADTSTIAVLVSFIFHDIIYLCMYICICVCVIITNLLSYRSLICDHRSFISWNISYITNHKLYLT